MCTYRKCIIKVFNAEKLSINQVDNVMFLFFALNCSGFRFFLIVIQELDLLS